MSWKRLTDGECGDESSLLKLTSHYTKDNTFSDLHTHGNFSQSDQMVQEFLQESYPVPQTFRMTDLMKEMQQIESQQSLIAPPKAALQVKDQLYDNIWADEYSNNIAITNGLHQNVAPKLDHNLIWAEILSREQENKLSVANVQNFSNVETQSTTGELYEQEYLQFVDFMKKNDIDSEIVHQADTSQKAESWTNEYVSNNLENIWNKEGNFVSKEGDKTDFWDKLQEEWKTLAEQSSSENRSWLEEFDTVVNSDKEYQFTKDNSMLDISNPFEKGKEMLAIGDFPSAILCFEAAVQKNPENVEAWLLLGTTQAENEQDPYAICALKKCLQLDPGNLKAHLALSVSYTNENYHNQACRELIQWLQHNEKYSDLVPAKMNFPDTQVSSILEPSEHNEVKELFLKAAQRQPLNPDYEVQCALGIVFNLSGEYDKAADCFRVALTVRPDDARLWNRLGATLANGNRPEEAVEAYHHALNLFPGFIRARYNVGITCINLNAYKEAAEHLLIALNQQAKGKDHKGNSPIDGSQMSATIWSTLRMCITLMNRPELRSLVENKDLKRLNQEFAIDN